MYDFIAALAPKHKAKALWEIELLSMHGTALKKPYVDSIKGDRYKGLMELRVQQGNDVKAEFLKDSEVLKEYEALRPQFELISQIISARNEQGITQAELAQRAGTRQSNISRLESGNYNPSLDFLLKVAESLDMQLHIELRQRSAPINHL